MSQRSTAPRDKATVRRTLHWFWWVTKKKPFALFMAIFTSVTYTALLNYDVVFAAPDGDSGCRARRRRSRR